MKIEVFSKDNWSDFIHDGKKGLDKNDWEIVAKKAFAWYYILKGGDKMVEQRKSITMKDVALEAGVSVGTVSRVINKEKGIKEVTLKKVEQAIKTLNYIQD